MPAVAAAQLAPLTAQQTPSSAVPTNTLAPIQVPSARSSSGQFVANAKLFGRTPPEVLRYSTNRGFMRLEPTLLSVSAERIKQLICRELDYSGPWRDKIRLSIRTARSTNDPVVIASDRYKDGWSYGLELPEVIDQQRYVRALTRAVLQEMANRKGLARSAELPAWLVEGFTQKLLTTYETEIILTPPNRGASGVLLTMTNTERENPLKRARKELMSQPGLSFQQLSWPSEEDLTGAKGEFYRMNAQVFIFELINMPGGNVSMLKFLNSLPDFLNWQFAFLRAFNAHFQRPLDIEKWWSLHLAHFSGRTLAEAWSAEESWLKLDELLGAQADVRSNTNELPNRTRVTLQVVVRDWNPADQSRWLQEVSTQLQMIRPRSQPQFIPLVDAYRNVIDTYLQRCGTVKDDTFSRSQRKVRRLAASAVEELDRLDLHRQAMRPPPRSQDVAAGPAK